MREGVAQSGALKGASASEFTRRIVRGACSCCVSWERECEGERWRFGF